LNRGVDAGSRAGAAGCSGLVQDSGGRLLEPLLRRLHSSMSGSFVESQQSILPTLIDHPVFALDKSKLACITHGFYRSSSGFTDDEALILCFHGFARVGTGIGLRVISTLYQGS
jgi:hypothetical protein